MKIYFLQIGFLLSVILLNCNLIFACYSYGNSNPACNEFYKSRAVFIGTVKSIEDDNNPKTFERSKIVLSVDENFLGADGEEFTIFDQGFCGYKDFQVGEKYLVYVNKNSLVVSGTSKIEKFPKAEKHVEELRSFLNKTDSSLFGRVYTYNKGYLENIKIKVEGYGQVFETYTDREGKFEIEKLGIGNYFVTADLPLNFRDTYGDKPQNSFSVEIQKGECERLDYTGRIKNKFWF